MKAKFGIALAVTLSTFAVAAPASAVVPIVSACLNSDISPTAAACAGWYDGNLLNNSGTHVQDQADALATIGFVWDKNWSAIDLTKIGVSPDGFTYNFPGLLDGIAYVGIHKGKGGKDGFESTAFFKIDADDLDTFKLNLKGGSDAVLYFNGGGGVPEPATWGMMILGIGMIGGAVRRSKQAVRYNFA